jgi:hypothetical protein
MSLKKFNINEEANKLVNRYEKILKEKSSWKKLE